MTLETNYLRWAGAGIAGTRLYREVPSSLLKSKSKKDQAEPQWELLGSTPEDLTELGEKLRRSKKKADQSLAKIVGHCTQKACNVVSYSLQ